MVELVTRSASNPEFPRVLKLSDLRDVEEFAFDVAPTAQESEALAQLMGAQSVRKMCFEGDLARLPQGGWDLTARLGATVVQTCVVTLDPVTTRVDQTVRRRFLPQTEAEPAEIVLLPGDEDDEIEPLSDRIDVGAVAAEALALALPTYPRKADAALETAPEADDGETPEKPFAALAVLKDRLREGG